MMLIKEQFWTRHDKSS